jgi:CheY-like chemotaxis protein/anti-sigma regulatory factor (Ser/Thr protein kinase)
LREIIEDALDTVRPAIEARELELISDLPDVLPVWGDPDRLRQVAWNLVSNAVKFTPHGGRVSVALSSDASAVELCVSDSGQGISPDFLPFVFERFRQADASTTRAYGGLGLGLSIVRHLVELHGGTVAVESEGEGQGASFRVRLPLITSTRSREPVADHLPPPPTTPENSLESPLAIVSESAPSALQGTRLLVVEDDADSRAFLVRALTDSGAEVFDTADAGEGFVKLREIRPDALISDIGMPEEDGHSLMRRIRALAPEDGGRTPALALTAFARLQDRDLALEAGFDGFLSKPVVPRELVEALSQLLHLSQP